MSTTKTTSSKFSIVRAIAAFLKLGEEGKLESFFQRIIKTLEKEVAAHKKNLDTIKFNHEQKLDELNDSLEDAQTALDESYLKIDLERITTNEAQKQFQDEYLTNIDRHVLAVQAIEKQIESENTSYEDKKTAIEAQIDSLEKRIDKISAE